jgi:hypothetical protein
MATSLPAGTKCHAKYKDGEFYVAEVVEWSTAKKKAKAPVKVHYLGYDASEDAWVTRDDIQSKQLEKSPKAKEAKEAKPPKETKNGAAESPKAKETETMSGKKKKKKGAKEAAAPAAPELTYSPELSAGTRLQALFEEENKYYVAEIVAIGYSIETVQGRSIFIIKVKVHYLGYGKDEDAWLTLDKVRSKTLTLKKGEAAPAKPAAKEPAPAKDAAPAMPAVGDKLKAKFTDGEMYAAEVVLVSTSKKKAKTPLKVHFVGYGEEEDLWVGDRAPENILLAFG